VRRALAAALLLAQLVSVAWHRRSLEKYFCWAPYDQQTRYALSVAVGGRTLTDDEAAARYRIRDFERAGGFFWDQRAYGNVLGRIERYETTYGRGDAAKVSVRYSVNGRPEEVWTWPR
jgi:hypothetical protein